MATLLTEITEKTFANVIATVLDTLNYSVEIPKGSNSKVIIRTNTRSKEERSEQLKHIQSILKQRQRQISLLKNVKIGEFRKTSNLSSAGSFRLSYTIIKSNNLKRDINIDVIAKPNEKASRGSSIKAVNYLPQTGTIKDLDLGKFGVVPCYYFSSAKQLEDTVLATVNKSPVFSAAQKEAISLLFDDGAKVSKGTDRFDITSITELNTQNLLVSFGEIYVPWLFLKQKVSSVNQLPDFTNSTVVGVAFPKGDLAKIDCIVLYKPSGRAGVIKHLYFSMKVGKGHEPSLIDFIKTDKKINWNNVNVTLAKIQQKFKSLPTRFGVMKGCCLYYMEESGCFKKSKPMDVYDAINKQFENKGTLTAEQTAELENFKVWLKKRYTSINIDKAFETNYPYSIPRLVALFIKTECEKPKCSKLIVEHVMQGGYFQLRINSSSASRGILQFEIIPIEASANAKVQFAITNGYTDFQMSSGNHFVGYTIS